MEFKEFGNQTGKTMLLLPGTACTWQLNFKHVIDDFANQYHIIAVNYDGFEGDRSVVFTDMLTVTKKIEDYIIEHHHGHVDGAYGSSLGGSFVGLLIQRQRIHIDHGFIGGSDLDQGNKVVAGLLTMIVSPMLSSASKSEKKRASLKAKLQKKGAIGEGQQSLEFANDFIDNMAYLNPKTISRQFYSDYITRLDNDIDVKGTTIHVIYATQMGAKYGQRYHQHFRRPDIHTFDMKHEVWLYDERWRSQVLHTIFECMEADVDDTSLGVVEDTLFVPMLGRIYASRNCQSILYDEMALSLQSQLPQYIIDSDHQTQYTYLASASRSANMDRYIKDFMMRHPEGIIVQLGCGLETTFYRNDNGSTLWYEIDLPDVINYRHSLLPESDRDIYIRADAFKEEWINDIRHQHPDAPLLVVASGLFYYFDEATILSLVHLLKQYGDIELLFDTVNKSGMTMMKKKHMKTVGHEDAKMFFYVDDAKEFANQIGGIEVLAEENFYKHINKKGLKLSTKLSMIISDALSMVKMIHLQL